MLTNVRISRRVWIQLAVLASERIEDPSQAIDFLRGTSERASQSRANESQQAALLLRLAVAKLHVRSGRIGDAKTIVQESRSQIEGMHDPAMELQAAFYSSSCDIFKANRQFSQFYKSALTYLAYANVDTLPMEERTIVGVDLILAALLGDDTYAFGELLRNPVVVELKTGPHQWLYALLQSVDAGDLQRFREVCIQNGPYFEAQPLLVSNRHKLEQKTSLLSLVNHITASATANAQFSFQSLSSSSKIPLEDVERLVMRAISLQLISGHMDEVTQVLTVTWVMPKQLTDAEVKQREEKVDVWSGRVHNVLLELENEVPELLLEA